VHNFISKQLKFAKEENSKQFLMTDLFTSEFHPAVKRGKPLSPPFSQRGVEGI
jgi:hypothetical protein